MIPGTFVLCTLHLYILKLFCRRRFRHKAKRKPFVKDPSPLSLLTRLPAVCRTEQRLPEPMCAWRYQSLKQKLARPEEQKRLQMLRAGEFKSSPAMWNPTFETLFLLVGKLIALQFWVKACFFQRKYKRDLAFSVRLGQPYPLCSSTLCFSLGPRFTPPQWNWHRLKGRIASKMWSGWREEWEGTSMEPLSHPRLSTLHQIYAISVSPTLPIIICLKTRP